MKIFEFLFFKDSFIFVFKDELKMEDKEMSRSSKNESGFQDRLRKEILDTIPGCTVIKQDAFQGIPDLLILYQDKWAMLENKKSSTAKKQPNQEYWVKYYDDMSFARFIFPENKESVLKELRSFMGV